MRPVFAAVRDALIPRVMMSTPSKPGFTDRYYGASRQSCQSDTLASGQWAVGSGQWAVCCGQ
jgi:hypothetical protein